MKVRINLSLADYVRIGNANTEGLLAGHHALMPLVNDYYDFFATKLWSDGQPIREVPMFLSTNAFMIWTSGVRMALSGHETAIYPLFRTALESACYALLISLDPALESIWSDRDKGDVERKASRKAFGGAVADVVKHLEAEQSGLGDFISSLYETSIDYGAHPNTLAIRNHVQIGPKTTEQKRFDQGSIYPGDSFQVFRALTSAAEYGRGIALVLIHCLPGMTPTVVEPLRALQLEFARIMEMETPDAEKQD
ncbi:hypothetical protein C8J45_10592 [Sphingomonas sp. PP-CE-3G-477]|jgi:hypothetical protein|nr:hypothetical protein [Sphingomonas sp. PP-CE-3G-477]PTQ63519.1 hypothetical protein C8J45_10592 [Sphingomonas sp. PP-CE-3G-477]